MNKGQARMNQQAQSTRATPRSANGSSCSSSPTRHYSRVSLSRRLCGANWSLTSPGTRHHPAFCSASFFPSIPQIGQDLGVSATVLNVGGVLVFLCMMAVSPLLREHHLPL